MAIYDTEEEQVEALQKWWKANSTSVITGIAVGLCLIFAGNFWKNYQQDKRLQASGIYAQLLDAESKDQPEQLEKLSKSLAVQYGSTAYAGYAALFDAKVKVQAGDFAAAKAILQKLIADADDDLKNVARLRLVRLMLATGEYEPALKLIAETNAASMQGFTSNYEELKGDLYVALDRLDEARTAYENALRDGAQSPLLQFKLDDLTSAAPNLPTADAVTSPEAQAIAVPEEAQK